MFREKFLKNNQNYGTVSAEEFVFSKVASFRPLNLPQKNSFTGIWQDFYLLLTLDFPKFSGAAFSNNSFKLLLVFTKLLQEQSSKPLVKEVLRRMFFQKK